MTGVAVVGRRFGCRVQVPALRAAGFDVVALVGRDVEPTAYKAGKLGIPHARGSLTEVLALPDVDAVAIATFHPLASRNLIKWDPMNPSAPVMKAVLFIGFFI